VVKKLGARLRRPRPGDDLSDAWTDEAVTDALDSPGTRSRGWAIVLDDTDGRSIRFGLDGVRAAGRERLLRIVSHHVDETTAEKVGPVDEVFALNPWFPAPPAPRIGAPRARGGGT
jgi:hypothetical protein